VWRDSYGLADHGCRACGIEHDDKIALQRLRDVLCVFQRTMPLQYARRLLEVALQEGLGVTELAHHPGSSKGSRRHVAPMHLSRRYEEVAR
jgi:hypothetical protein